ncbi:hypothetical protein N7474_000905 [Penicillium riverlandense]|uniref:uncharacterized protein n=1 Tax=Penicillium riverlandense TaxID=1903569 RepID=UPI00254914E4|nr:uncharacterized protein N7474_000905 [Penicillium riverlandense]KAJ5832594.1 hypothetical protein N7474_000905 [Penicillium riverlandense]
MSFSVKTIDVAMPPEAKLNSPRPSEVTLTEGGEITKLEKYRSEELGSVDLESPSDEKQLDLEAQTVKPKRLAALRYTALNLYRRLFTLVVLANMAVFVAVMTADRKLLALVNATAGNLLACGLARQPLVVNTIFWVVCSMPRSSPLFLRRMAAKVYHYGGVHSGCGIAALIWYMGFIGVMSHEYWQAETVSSSSSMSAAPVVLAYTILALLLVIIVVAHPTFRMKRHDYFELTHRFCGWLVIAMFVALLLVFARETSRAQDQPLGRFLITLPVFWFLVITVVAIIHPWLLLRKVPVRAEVLSSHAVRLHLDHTTTSFGKGIQLAKHPLRDWHGFATFPDADHEQPSFSALVSKAGDWTRDCIQQPPQHLWKRGVLIYGVAYAMRVFRRVIVVTTGSGIGPCLSFLGDEHRPALRVVWQTRAPLNTYGQGVLDLVRRMDSDPIIMDTDKSGRVDMLPMVQRLVREFDAEAVCVISNPVLTRRLVYGLEARGTPAFGPIFDS